MAERGLTLLDRAQPAKLAVAPLSPETQSLLLTTAAITARANRKLFDAYPQLDLDDAISICCDAGLRAISKFIPGGRVNLRNWMILAMRSKMIETSRRLGRAKKYEAHAIREEMILAPTITGGDQAEDVDFAIEVVGRIDPAMFEVRHPRQIYSAAHRLALAAMAHRLQCGWSKLQRRLRSDPALRRSLRLTTVPGKEVLSESCLYAHAALCRRKNRYHISSSRRAAIRRVLGSANSFLAMDALLDYQKLAELLLLKKRTIRSMVRQGRFPRADVIDGNLRRWKRETVLAWMDAGGKIINHGEKAKAAAE